MNLNNYDKTRILFGTLIGMLCYFSISLIVKLCGYDIFYMTENIPILIKINDFVLSNIFLEDFVRTLIYLVSLIFIFGFCGRIYNWKKLFILSGITFPIIFGFNLLIYYFNFPEMILSVVIPFIILSIYSLIYTDYCLFKNEKLNRRLNSFLTMTILYIGLSLFNIIFQQIILFLKFTFFKFTFVNTNIFSLILLNLETWVAYFLSYMYCKILNKEEENNGRKLVVLFRFHKIEKCNKIKNQIDLNFRQKLVYYGILLLIQLFQLTGVVIISLINNAFYEFIGIYLGLIVGRIIFRKSWHSRSILICSFITFITFFLLTRASLPVNTSITCSYLLGILLAFILYIFAELEEKVNTNITIKEDLGETKVDLKNMTINELENLCIKNCFSETDTNFLIDFIKNPKGLKKYEIAIKYNYERSYIYQRARKLIKILEDTN